MTADFHVSIERHKYRYNMYICIRIYMYIFIFVYIIIISVFFLTLDKLSAWPTVPMEAFTVILQWHIACIS